jgi:hypothetical protein
MSDTAAIWNTRSTARFEIPIKSIHWYDLCPYCGIAISRMDRAAGGQATLDTSCRMHPPFSDLWLFHESFPRSFKLFRICLSHVCTAYLFKSLGFLRLQCFHVPLDSGLRLALHEVVQGLYSPLSQPKIVRHTHIRRLTGMCHKAGVLFHDASSTKNDC